MATVAVPGSDPARDGRRQAAGWPLRAGLDLWPLKGSTVLSRDFTRMIAAGWGLEPLTDRAGLVAEQLAGQAVMGCERIHGCPPVRLRLMSDARVLLVAAWDPVPHIPDPAGTGLEAPRLDMAAALADQWNWRLERQGKTVWCLLDARAAQRIGREATRKPPPSRDVLTRVLAGLRALP